MRYDLLVDVSEGLDPELRDQLLALSYRASRWQQVGVVLRGISPQEADRRLDPVVAREGSELPGVRYLDPDGVESLLRGNGGSPSVIVTRDPTWIPAVDGSAPDVRSPAVGIEMLKQGALATGPA